jgi:hydroxymethylbilane synthase
VETALEIIKTTGDKITDVPLAKVGTRVCSLKARRRSSSGESTASHSLKDMPTVLPDGLTLATTPEREDPRDAIVGARLADLPLAPAWVPVRWARGTVARSTASLQVESVRGNLDTRLRKLDEGQYRRSCWRPRDCGG